MIDDGPIIINNHNGVTPNYIIQGNIWDHRIITYWFSNGTNDIPLNYERIAIRYALDIWQNQTDIRFLQVCDSIDADITFMWVIGNHGDGYNFDGVGGILAHAFYPPPNGIYAGDVHFDDAETWTTDIRESTNQPIDLLSIAAHEIGHSLGLDHSAVSSALMYAYYSGSHRYLNQDDINGIINIYGYPGTYNFYSGPSIICTSGTFTINNPPSNSTITWSCGTYLTRVSAQGSNPCTFRSTGYGSSYVQATITSGCGIVTLPQKTVWAGVPLTPTAIMGFFQNGAEFGSNSIYEFSVLPQTGVTNNVWDVGGGTILDGQGTSTIRVRTYDATYHDIPFSVGVKAGNICGLSARFVHTGWVIPGTGGATRIVITPNPSSDETTLTIESATENNTDVSTTWTLEVYDQSRVLKSKKANLKGKKYILNTSGWKNGVYIIRVNYNGEWITGKLAVERKR